MLHRILHQFPTTIALIGVAFAASVAALGAIESAQRQRYQSDISKVEVVPPAGAPPQTQASIQTALQMFSIHVPASVEGPYFDAQLDDRGLTTGGLILPQKRVTIGPAAFTSWAVLGSTLAHEIEVHVEQSFLKVVLQDQVTQMYYDGRRTLGRWVPELAPSAQELFENDGTWKAERDAYMYELSNARRFGLSKAEVASIWRVMDYFYPNKNGSSSEAHLSASSAVEDDNGGTDSRL
jgi:hypothetical protein